VLCTALGTAQVNAAHVASSSAPRWRAPIFLRSSKHKATFRFHKTLVEKCAAHTSAARASAESTRLRVRRACPAHMPHARQACSTAGGKRAGRPFVCVLSAGSRAEEAAQAPRGKSRRVDGHIPAIGSAASGRRTFLQGTFVLT